MCMEEEHHQTLKAMVSAKVQEVGWNLAGNRRMQPVAAAESWTIRGYPKNILVAEEVIDNLKTGLTLFCIERWM